MRYRAFGSTQFKVSEVGFGGGGIGHVWGPTTDEECLRAIGRALELGVNFYDVAPGYGAGKAEELLGKGLKGNRDRVYVATKVALQVEDMSNIPANTRRIFEGSLRRLQMEYVDILFVHNRISIHRGDTTRSISTEDALNMVEAFKKFRQEGKVKYFGFTAWNGVHGPLYTLVDSGEFDCLQAEYSLLNQTSMEQPPLGTDFVDPGGLKGQGSDFQRIDQGQLIPAAASKGVAVVGIRPLLAGALSDAIDRPVEAGSPMDKNIRRAKALTFLKEGGKRTLSQAAITFVLMNSQIATVIPGVKSVAEIEEAASCSESAPISREHLQLLKQLYAKDFGVKA